MGRAEATLANGSCCDGGGGEVVFGMAVVADVTEGVEAEMVDGVEHGEELVLALEDGVADDAEVGNF